MTARRAERPGTEGWEPISPERFAAFGVQAVAFVKPVEVKDGDEDGDVFAVCAADGTEIARFADRAVAFAAIRQHDLEPLSLH